MTIKQKLIANTAILIIAMIIMLGLLTFSSSSLQTDVEVARKIGNIEAEVLQLRRNEKDFLARKDPKYLDKFNKVYGVLVSDVNFIDDYFDSIDLSVPEVGRLKGILKEYQGLFSQVVDAQKEIGLNPKDALYGELRSAVHGVESLLGDKDYQLLSNMLQLRRNEKDFMLRLDDKYFDKWRSNAEKFVVDVKASALDAATKSEVEANIGVYQSAFGNLVQAQKRLGYDSNSGLQGDMRAAVHKVDKDLAQLLKVSRQTVEDHSDFISSVAHTVFILVLVIAIGFALFITKTILQTVILLKDSMNKVSETKDLSLVVNSTSNDELAEVANVFNNMIASFRNLIVEVNHSVDTVHDATQNLSQNIHAANEGVDSQIQQTDLVATAVTEMVATVDEIANNTHEAASKAEQTNKNAEMGKGGVDSTIAKIDQLSAKLLESEQVVQELAKDSDTIGSVLDVIRGIAEQTNLLALNAAIEAARAGEQGRGFAVVADEVRTLASRTQDSTQEIEGIISSLQSRTKEIVSHMAACRTQGQESADQAGSAGAMLEEITADVSTIMDMNTAIATAIQQQSTVASEVNQHVVMIRDVAESSGQAAHQNAEMSEELSAQADVLNREVNQFKV